MQSSAINIFIALVGLTATLITLSILYQGLCRNAVDHIKIFDNNDPRVPQSFVAWVIIIKIFNVINSISAQALATPF